MSRRGEIACVLAAAALAAPAVALADSPPNTTTTEPVSTVTTLPSPTAPAVSTPAPDAAPVHKAAHTRPKPVVHSAPIVHRSVTPAPASAPVRSSSSTPQQSSRPVVTVYPAKKKVVRHSHRATRSSPREPPASAKHAPPVTKPPKPVRAPAPAPVLAPAAQSSGNSWVAPAVIGVLIALLVALALVAGIRAMRRTEGQASAPSDVPPPPLLPLALAAAPATTIEHEPELEPTPIVAPPSTGSCRIAWWRGYLRSRFYAYEGNGDGETKLVAESPLFSWHSSEPPPESAAALAAYARLIETLERLGWEPDGPGENWFSGRFQRAIVSDVSRHGLAPAAQQRAQYAGTDRSSATGELLGRPGSDRKV